MCKIGENGARCVRCGARIRTIQRLQADLCYSTVIIGLFQWLFLFWFVFLFFSFSIFATLVRCLFSSLRAHRKTIVESHEIFISFSSRARVSKNSKKTYNRKLSSRRCWQNSEPRKKMRKIYFCKIYAFYSHELHYFWHAPNH